MTPRIQFITQMREPVARAVSQYKFWKTRMGKQVAPEQFLEHHTSANFQTKKIAGCEDLDLAKKTIRDQYLLAGTVENFDEFLVLLSNKLKRPLELFVYSRQNEGVPNAKIPISEEFLDELRKRNELDSILYRWVTTELTREYISTFDGNFKDQLATFRTLQKTCEPPAIPKAIDFVYRNIYWKPVTGLIRKLHGLPYSGSYGSSRPVA